MVDGARQKQEKGLKNQLYRDLTDNVLGLLTLVWSSQQFVGDHGGQANWIAAFVLSVFPLAEALPYGLHTMVDEAGLRFSGGERHRLALARILLQETPIIILDEPTVGLDPITEKAPISTFMEELQGKTLTWITHHLKGIEAVDRVIFLENSQLEMSGSPEELARTSDRYRMLKAIDDGE